MKHLFTILLLSLCLSTGKADTINVDLFCDNTTTITRYILEKYKEVPYLLGSADDVAGSKLSFWVNKKTKTWTLLATKDDITCVIGYGSDFKLILGLDT